MSQLSAEMTATLMRLGSATLHEAQDKLGALDPALKPIDPKQRLAGRALTIDAVPGDNLILHYALTFASPGDVLVIDAKGHIGAGLWGDILTLAAQKRGVAGLVVDGAVRDADSIIAMGFPVFSRGLCIKATFKNQPGLVNTPIICGGVRITRGDVIVGDRDGVVAIPSGNLDATLRMALQRAEAEDRLRAAILAGRSTIDLLGLRPTLERLKLAEPRA